MFVVKLGRLTNRLGTNKLNGTLQHHSTVKVDIYDERRALKDLKARDDIVINKADKGSTIAIQDIDSFS